MCVLHLVGCDVGHIAKCVASDYCTLATAYLFMAVCHEDDHVLAVSLGVHGVASVIAFKRGVDDNLHIVCQMAVWFQFVIVGGGKPLPIVLDNLPVFIVLNGPSGWRV